MRKCNKCDFPVKFARFFDWRSDGTIISTDRTKMRSQIIFLEAGELESLFSDLSATIGMNVDSILIQAQKNLGKAIYANLPVLHIKGLPTSRFFRPQFVARLLVRLIAPDIAGLGDGRLSLDSYLAGDHLHLRFRDPVVSQLLVGSAAGIYESVEEMPSAAVNYAIEDGDLVIRLSHSEKPAEGTERLYLEEIEPGEGPLQLDRCQSCGVPGQAARMLSWDVGRGIIRNKLTGRREVVIAVQAVNAILRELESELGEEIPSVLYGHEKEFTKGHLSAMDMDSGGADLMERHLTDLAIRGLGYPVRFEREAGSISVEITNAFNQVLYAAKLAACLEVETGSESSIKWVKREATDGVYTISTQV